MKREPLAIVGVGCRLPGGITSLDALRELFLSGRSAIDEVPSDRWDASGLFHPDFRKHFTALSIGIGNIGHSLLGMKRIRRYMKGRA